MADDWNRKVIEEFRANAGKVESFVNAPLLILHTTGAKSGRERESPVLYREQGEDLVVFASYAGAPVHPAWYHNLVANPDASVELGTGNRAVRARVAEGEERDRLWEWNKHDYPGFGDYDERLADKRTSPAARIALMSLDPRNITLEPGDAICVYAGREKWQAANATRAYSTPFGPGPLDRPGLHVSCLPFLRDHDVSLLVWDMLDHLPIGYDIPWAVHAALFAYGVALLDNALLEPLASACIEEGRDDFMLVIAPLRVVGGTGSPANPLAVF